MSQDDEGAGTVAMVALIAMSGMGKAHSGHGPGPVAQDNAEAVPWVDDRHGPDRQQGAQGQNRGHQDDRPEPLFQQPCAQTGHARTIGRFALVRQASMKQGGPAGNQISE